MAAEIAKVPELLARRADLMKLVDGIDAELRRAMREIEGAMHGKKTKANAALRQVSRQAEFFRKRRTLGLCVTCGEPAARKRDGTVFSRCAQHLEQQRNRYCKRVKVATHA